jgi:hypothetical protein
LAKFGGIFAELGPFLVVSLPVMMDLATGYRGLTIVRAYRSRGTLIAKINTLGSG